MSHHDKFQFGSGRVYALPQQDLIWGYTLRNTTAHYPIARRDPILTPIFTSFFINLGFSASAAAIAGAATTAIVTTAISIGVQALLAPRPPKPEDGKVPKVQSIPHRWWGVGRNRTAGAYMLWEAKGKKLCAVQAIRGHRIKSFNRYWLHDDEVTLDVDGYVQREGKRYGSNKVQIKTRLGLVPETPYSEIVAILGSDGTWTNNHRGDGQASVGMTAGSFSSDEQAKRFPFGAPVLSVETDDALVWDPRDPAQDPEDPDTWQWSRNAALIMLWHQCFNEFGHRRDYTRAILPVLDMWIEEADICDELVPLNGGGTERRYECNGFDTTENDPKAATNAILASCDGWLCERGDGALLFTVGKFRESRVATLSDVDIVGHQVQYGVLFEDEINRLIPKFTYPAIGYATSDTDFFEDTAAQLEAGRVLAQDANYQWVHQWRQARRLGKRDWLRIQENVSGSIDVRLSGINAVYARWIRLDTPKMMPRLNGKLIENRKAVLSLLQGGFSMTITKHPDDIDAWDETTDEGLQPPVPPKPNAEDILTPVLNLVQAISTGGSVYIRVVIIDPEDDSLTPVVRYRVTDLGTGNPGQWVEQRFPDAVPDGGFVELATQTVPVDEEIDVEVAFIASDGDYGNWTPTETVIAAADPVAPAALTSFTQTAAAPHLGNAVFSIVTPNDAHIRTVKLYRKASGAALDLNVDNPFVTLNVAPSATYSHTHGDATRTNMLSNGDFASDTVWTKGAGWTIAAGKATHAGPTASSLSQSQSPVAGDFYRLQFTVSGRTVDTIVPRFAGGTTANGVIRSSNATFLDRIQAATGNTLFAFVAGSTFDGSVDDVVVYHETASCVPQGAWDYYAVPFNVSNIAGTPSGPLAVTIV